MANAKEDAAAESPIPKNQQHPRDPFKRKPMRRCAKCATPKPESHFKGDKDTQSPYCAACCGRFPSLAGRVLTIRSIPSRKR